MIWRRLREWRDRRATLRELDAFQRGEERDVIGDQLNPLNLAKLALEREQYDTAGSRWEEARERLPNYIYESEDSLPILLGLRRYEEAEAFVQEGRRRSPRNRRWIADFARIAEHRGDYAEAARRWKRAQGRGADIVGAWVREGVCLTRVGRYAEAVRSFNHVLRLDSTQVDAFVGRIQVFEALRDWPRAEDGWRSMAEILPYGFVFAGRARALMELGRFDEAGAILDQACREFPSDLDLRLTRAHLEERRGDLTAACDRWKELQSVVPYFVPGYRFRTECLYKAERHAEADEVMRNAMERFPGESWPLYEYAMLAHRLEDWPEASARWEALRTRFPEREEGYGWGSAALDGAGRHEEARALRRDA